MFIVRFLWSAFSNLCLLGLSLLPLSSLLLFLPAVVPDESVLANSIRPQRSFLARTGRRLFAVLSGLAMLIAILAASLEVVNALGLSNPYFGSLARKVAPATMLDNLPPVLVNQWPYVILVAYGFDLLVLFAIGKVPLTYSVRNILVRWRISLLTALAFTVVVGLLVVMLAFLNGLNEMTAKSGNPANVLALSDGATDELFSNFSRGDITKVELAEATLDRNDNRLPTPARVAKIVRPDGVTVNLCSRETYFTINQPVQAETAVIPPSAVPAGATWKFAFGAAVLALILLPATRNFLARWVSGLGVFLLAWVGLGLLIFAGREVNSALAERGLLSRDDVEVIQGGWPTEVTPPAGGEPAILSTEAAIRFGPANGKNTLKFRDRFMVRGKPYVVAAVIRPKDESKQRIFAQMWVGDQVYFVERPRRRFVQLRGIEDSFIAGLVHNVDFVDGGWYPDSGVVDTPDGRHLMPAVMGEGAASTFGADVGKPRLQAGDEFKLGDLDMIVSGIVKSDGQASASEIWTKNKGVADEFGKLSFTRLVMRAENDSTAAADALAYHFANRFSTPRLKSVTEPLYYRELGKTNDQIFGVVVIVAAIMAIGGVFGVMNTMFAAISQRTRDIGVLRILGFKRWQILVSFMLESLFLAMIGGLIGCAVGSIADGYTAQSILSSGGGGGKTVVLRITVDANVLICGMLFTLVMGRLGGLLPALSGMRLGILESLR